MCGGGRGRGGRKGVGGKKRTGRDREARERGKEGGGGSRDSAKTVGGGAMGRRLTAWFPARDSLREFELCGIVTVTTVTDCMSAQRAPDTSPSATELLVLAESTPANVFCQFGHSA